MTETYIPRAIAAGCRLISNTKIKRIKLKGRKWQYAEAFSGFEGSHIANFKIRFQNVFVPLQTWALEFQHVFSYGTQRLLNFLKREHASAD